MRAIVWSGVAVLALLAAGCGGDDDGDGVEVDALERDLHVGERIHRHAYATDLAHGKGVVRIEPDLRRQIESHVEPGLPVFDEVLEAFVGVRRVAEARVLAHRVRSPAVHFGVDAARIRILARCADHPESAGPLDIRRGVERLDLDARFVAHLLALGSGHVVHAACSRI